MKSILILGGARSGKSSFAQKLAAGIGDKVLFVATAEAKDEDMRLRIERHKKSRPEGWRTLEAPLRVSGEMKKYLADSEVVIIDCITMLVSNIILQSKSEASGEEAVLKEVNELVEVMGMTAATFIIVSNEVGMGVVPDNELGRRYRDCLGRANQLLAQHADEVHLLAAGIPVRLK